MAEKVKVDVEANASSAVKELEKVAKATKDVGGSASASARQVSQMASAMKALAMSDIGSKIASFASSIAQTGVSCVMAAAQMRQYEIAFQTMLKSAEQGTQMLKDLQQFAANTPFDVPGVVQAGQQLMAFGFKAKEIVPMLTSLGDAAAGLGKGTAGVSQLAYALGQMQTSGKLNTQDMMQLTNAGIAAWDMLAQAAGKSVMEIKDLTSKGAIDSKEAVKIIIDGINQQFGGMMDKTSQEVTGLMANIEETAGNTATVIGQYMIKAFDIKGILKNVSDTLGEFQQKMQEAADNGKSFTDVIKECFNPGLVVAAGALAAVIGTVLVAAFAAAVAALGPLLGVSAATIGIFAGLGAVTAGIAVYWDELVNIAKLVGVAVGGMGVAVLTTISSILVGSANVVADIVKSITDCFGIETPKWVEDVRKASATAYDHIADWAKNAMRKIKEVFNVLESTNANAELAQIVEDDRVFAAGKKKVEAPTTRGSLIMDPQKTTKGAHHKTEEEREIDALLRKYNKVGETFKDLEYKAKALSVAASTMFGNGKVIGDHKAALANINAEHDKLNSQYEAELELAAKIADTGDRAYVISQIKAQRDAEKELFEAKLNAENYKFEHRNDKSSSDLAKSFIDKAFGTEDEMAKKKESLQKALTEMQDMLKNASQTGQEQTLAEGMTQESLDFMSKMLKMTPEELQAELDSKSMTLEQFVDKYSTSLAAMTAAQQKNKSIGEQWANAQIGWVKQIGSSIGSAVADWITGTKSIGQAMAQMVRSLLSNAMQLLGEWLAIFAIMSIWNPPQAAAAAANKIVLGIGDGTSGGKATKIGGSTAFKPSANAAGGYITGAGTATSDSIPAMLSNGEYVIRASAVDELGVPFLDGLNSGKYTHRANGGLVGSAGSFSNDVGGGVAAGSGSNVTVNISAVDASGFGDFLNRGGLDKIKQALTEDNRMFGSPVGVW